MKVQWCHTWLVLFIKLQKKNGFKNLNNFQIILTIIGILIPKTLQSPISFPENNNVRANRRNDEQRSRQLSNNYNNKPQGGPLGFFGQGGLFDFSGGQQQQQQQQPQQRPQQYNDYNTNRPTSNYNRLFFNQNRLTTTQLPLSFDSVEDYDENAVSADNISSQDTNSDPQKTNSKYGGLDDSRKRHGHRRKKPCIPYQKNYGPSSKTFYEFNYQNIIVNGHGGGGGGLQDPQSSNVFYDPVGGYPCVEQNYAGHRPHRPHGGGAGGGSQQTGSAQNDQVSRPPGFFSGLVDAFGPGGAFGQGGYFTGVNFPNGQNGQNDGQNDVQNQNNNIGNIVNPVLAQVSDTVNNAFTPASVQVSDTVEDAVVDADYPDDKPVVEVNVPDTLQDAVLNFI